MEVIMMNLAGKVWGSFNETEKENMLCGAVAVDATTCNTPHASMECIIDLQNGLSVEGFYNAESGDIEVNDSAVIYNPAE